MLQPSLAGADCPSVVETAAASVFTHLDPAIRRVHDEHMHKAAVCCTLHATAFRDL
jgi:hypothetical protein